MGKRIGVTFVYPRINLLFVVAEFGFFLWVTQKVEEDIDDLTKESSQSV